MKNYKAHSALIVANLLYGISYPVSKSLMPDYLSPIEIIVLRAGITSIMFWSIHRFFFYEKVERKDLLKLALCGLFGVAINQILFFEGLNLTTPIDSSIIMVSNPIMVLIISGIVIKEKITYLKMAGIILGAAGAIITIVYGKQLSAGSDPVRGNIYVFVNAFSYAVYMVLVKPLMEKYKPFTVMKWTFIFGSVCIIPVSLNTFRTVDWSAFNVFTWSALVYVIIATTFVAYLLIGFSMKYVNASVASFYIYFQPVIASLLATIMYDEKITFVKVLSALMIFTGVFLVSAKKKIIKSA